jgi:hypothetical protein
MVIMRSPHLSAYINRRMKYINFFVQLADRQCWWGRNFWPQSRGSHVFILSGFSLFRFILELFILWQSTLSAFQRDYYFYKEKLLWWERCKHVHEDLLYTFISMRIVLLVGFVHCVWITYREFLCTRTWERLTIEFFQK